MCALDVLQYLMKKKRHEKELNNSINIVMIGLTMDKADTFRGL